MLASSRGFGQQPSPFSTDLAGRSANALGGRHGERNYDAVRMGGFGEEVLGCERRD